MTKIYTDDTVRFPAGPGILALPNGTAVTCPGRYTVTVKGKYEFRAYAGDVEKFTVSARPASRAERTTHELGTAPEPKTAAAAEDTATADEQNGTGA